jgi:hypothetical protein
MLALRINLMEVILQSPDSNTIEKLVGESLNHRFENMPSELSRFIKLFESDLMFQLRQNPSNKKERNLMETQRVLREIIEKKNVTA